MNGYLTVAVPQLGWANLGSRLQQTVFVKRENVNPGGGGVVVVMLAAVSVAVSEEHVF